EPHALSVRDARILPAELPEEDVSLRVVGHATCTLRPTSGVGAAMRDTTTALAMCAVTIVVVLRRSGMTSIAMRIATPSTGMPRSPNTGAIRKSDPLGTGGTL